MKQNNDKRTMNKGTKSKAGRKPYADKTAIKRSIQIYLSQKEIDERGGIEVCRQSALKHLLELQPIQ